MRELKLNSLLGNRFPCASFHDAVIHTLSIDYNARILTMRCSLDVSDPDAPNITAIGTAQGTLLLSGLIYCILPPPDNNYSFEQGELEITSNGNYDEVLLDPSSASLPEVSDDAAFVHWFFVSNWNAFIWVAAIEAEFVWD